jgi:hypothetical protein
VDHYECLGLPRDASPAQVTQAFRRAARRTHPDAGGRPSDFVAVAEAYRVLGDPLLRAQYDRELDGGPAGWDEVDWGTEVGGEAPEGEPSAGPAGGDDVWHGDVDLHDGPADDGEANDEGADPRRLDAFVGPPRRIPDPLADPAAPALPSIRPGRVETSAAVVAWVLGLVALALLVVAATRGAWGRSDAGAAAGDDGVSTTIAWVSVCAFAVILHALSPPRSRGTAAAWIFTCIGLVMLSPVVGGVTRVSEGPRALHIAALATAVSAVAVALAWALAFARRRAHPDRLTALWQRDPGWRADRYHRAVAWNLVRTALQVPGTTALAVGPAARDSTGVPFPGRRWTWDPRTGIESVRTISRHVPLGSWLVLDDEDRVVAGAPVGAPEAWLSALREVPARPASRARA